MALSIINRRVYVIQFTHATVTQVFRSTWEVCTYVKIDVDINRDPTSDNNMQVNFT